MNGDDSSDPQRLPAPGDPWGNVMRWQSQRRPAEAAAVGDAIEALVRSQTVMLAAIRALVLNASNKEPESARRVEALVEDVTDKLANALQAARYLKSNAERDAGRTE